MRPRGALRSTAIAMAERGEPLTSATFAAAVGITINLARIYLHRYLTSGWLIKTDRGHYGIARVPAPVRKRLKIGDVPRTWGDVIDSIYILAVEHSRITPRVAADILRISPRKASRAMWRSAHSTRRRLLRQVAHGTYAPAKVTHQTQLQLVLDAVRASGHGLRRHQVVAATGVSSPVVGAALSRLVKRGLLVAPRRGLYRASEAA